MSVAREADYKERERKLEEARNSCRKCHGHEEAGEKGMEWAIDDVNGGELPAHLVYAARLRELDYLNERGV